MTPGESTLELIDSALDNGAEHIVLLMRHSAREFAPDKHDLLNPLTDEGRELARSMGKSLPKSLLVRGYTSPAERCVETAELIMSGHNDGGGQVTRNRVIEALGVFYVLDQMKMFMAMQASGGLVPFLNKWFEGEVQHDILIPPEVAAGVIGRLAATKLAEAQTKERSGPQLDLLVSHDFTVYTLKAQLLGQDTTRYPDVHFLDGIAFFEREGKTYVQSHHEEAIELQIGT
jgi:hypothetical protein